MGKGNKTAYPVEHVICLMLENRSFDHMVGFLKRLNPTINGLNGKETNPYDPSNPSGGSVTVSDDAPYVTVVDPGHSVTSTTTQLWGNENQTVVPPMDGFVLSYNVDAGDSSDDGAAIMQCFNSQTVPAISTLATSFAIFDHWFASIPGPTQPNRMYLFSATSHGAASNDDLKLALGYPQKTIFDSLYENGNSFGVYYSDFPACLVMRSLRKPEYWPYIKQIQQFYDDCKNGTLPNYSFIEPRWFELTNLGASDQHPPHDVSLGENLIADIYEAIRSSPLWEKSLLIVTYDEHGGFYDHVPTPTQNVPNPDGIDSDDPPFDFNRLGVRIPTIMASPWIKSGSVFHAPNEVDLPEGQVGSQFEHSSICATLKCLFNIPDFLTNRDAWAATFHNTVFNSEYPRIDCPTQLPVPGGSQARSAYKLAESILVNDDTIERDEKLGRISTLPLSELQYEVMQIANGLNGGKFDIYSLKTEHEGAIFVRECLYRFLHSVN